VKERRKYERFQLELPARLEMNSLKKREAFEFHTKDVSAAGVFLNSAVQIPEGTRCQLELTVPSDTIKELTGAQSLIKVEGTVVRVTEKGLAICFDGECEILCLRAL
jgi:hypothetical protein